MKSFYQDAKNTFLERSNKNLISLYIQMQKNNDFLENADNVEKSYHILKQIRDSSAIFQIKELYELTSHLLKYYKINGLNYELSYHERRIIIEGISILLNTLFSNDSSSQITASLSKFKNIDEVKIKVLILDDDYYITEWLKEKLADSEFQIIVSEIPENIVSYLLVEKIDLIIIDMMLPNQKGFELLKQIRQHQWTKNFPIIATTHNRNEQHAIDILESYVDGILNKPYSIRLFIGNIKNIIDRSKKHTSLELQLNTIQREEMINLLNKEWVRFQRFQSYFSLLIVKLDMYDKLVENYGAEKVLNYFSQFYQLIRQSTRTYDEIKKWHQDSFLLLLPATRLEGAFLVGKRLKNLTNEIDSPVDLSSNVLIGVIESDLNYNGVIEIVKRLEKELITTITDSGICKVLPLSDTIVEQKQERRKKVFVIDDDPIPPIIIQNHLNSDEWEVEICSDGKEAMHRLLEIKPDFIISEIRTKELDGFTFCYQLRQFPIFRDTIFIFLSDQTITKSIIRGFQSGADDYITKPFSVQELEARMQRHWLRRNKREG